jgi:Leu/Phe-tRNA-protein transferase
LLNFGPADSNIVPEQLFLQYSESAFPWLAQGEALRFASSRPYQSFSCSTTAELTLYASPGLYFTMAV